jgi:hypothetical protein
MLDYKELSLNPYHLNRNQQTEQEKVEAQGPSNFGWGDLLGLGTGALTDYWSMKGPSTAQLQHSISPLEESYKNLIYMADQYRDPGSELNVQQRNVIRNRNLEATTDIMRRAANEAQGTVDDSIATKGITSTAIQTAIADALKNYNLASGDRLKMASDYDAKAAAAAHTLATARQQNLLTQQAQKEKQGRAGSEFLQGLGDWWSGGGSDTFSKGVDTVKGWFGW